jgi:hypothetical protein
MTKAVMLSIAAANVLAALLIYFLGHAGWGFAATLSISKFHDLTTHRVVQIDTEALKRVTDGQAIGEYDVPLFLNEGFRGPLAVLNVAAVALLVDARIMSYVGRSPRGTRSSTD